MFISSVSTIVFNANPLLRYDGYYILADLMEIPNLRQKATTILSRKLSEWCLGMEPPEDPFLPQRNQVFFALYSIAAAAYRWVVALSICWFLYKLFERYNLKIVGQGVVLMSLWGLLGMPLYQVGKFFYVPGRVEQVKKPRFYTSLGVVVALLAGALFVPLPYSVICPLEIQARDAVPVYVDVPGKLISLDVAAGQQVCAGQRLAQLRSIDFDLEMTKLKGAADDYRVKLGNLRQESYRDRHAADQIASVEKSLKAVEEQLKEKARDEKRLTLTAPVAGMVLPPPMTPPREQDEERLPSWSGTPLDPENLGAVLEKAVLEKDVLFCQLGDPKRLEAVLVIDQTDRNVIREGQDVDLMLEGLPFITWHCKIAGIAERAMDTVSQRMTTKSGGEVPTKTDPHTGIEHPMSASYQARVPIDDPEGLVRLGIRGQARVYTDWLPLGTRLWRLVAHTFNFKM
jgi:putative peptide zinc metalloprotease protein